MAKVNLPQKQRSVRLSNLQFCQLQALLHSDKSTFGMDMVMELNQLTLGSVKRRGFITETKRRDGVVMTNEGREVLRSFEQANFMRKVGSTNFSSFLHLDSGAQAKKLQIVQRRGRAA